VFPSFRILALTKASTPCTTHLSAIGMSELFSLPFVHAFSIQNGNLSKLGVGTLSIYAMDVHMMLLHIPGVFQHPITADFPCLRASHLSFVFSGQNGFCLGAGQEGLSFGIILSNSTSSEDLDMFEALLSEYTQYRVEEAVFENAECDDKTQSTSSKSSMSSFLRKGLKKGLQSGAAVASMGLKKSNAFLKKQITSRSNVQISAQTKARIAKMKAMAVGAKSVCSDFVVAALDATSMTDHGPKPKLSIDGKEGGIEKVVKPKTIWEELQDSALVLVTKGPDLVKDAPKSKAKKAGFWRNPDFLEDLQELEINVEF